jgi:predicted permease
MNLRQKLQVILLLFLILVTFASYHQGSTAWLQWLTVVSLLFFAFVFDLLFTTDAHFIFDPDAENWRRKTVRKTVLWEGLSPPPPFLFHI